MKKYLFLIISCLIICMVIVCWPRSEKPQVLGEAKKPVSQTTPAWFLVATTEKIKLYPNYQEKLTTQAAKTKYGCESIVSGGFYSTENKPLGLVISEKVKVAGYRKADLFNGIYSINDFLTPRITRQIPADDLRVALQSGPILIENSLPIELQLSRDSQARRVVVATTGDNETIFIIYYDTESVYMGPLLADLPRKLMEFQEENNLQIADAINLDGGTASAFYNAGINLPEASLVGSFFCILPR